MAQGMPKFKQQLMDRVGVQQCSTSLENSSHQQLQQINDKNHSSITQRFTLLIHHQSLSQNTPVLTTKEHPAQTLPPKKPDKEKFESTVGSTCLGVSMCL
jgi:hypothetical protein